jgi:death-on-curing protein
LAHFYDLTYDDIVNIHNETIARFSSYSSSKIHRGILNEGLLEDIAKRPSQKHYDHVPFPDIYSRCATLMETIIKWHPFVDGNKRTALAVAYSYIYKNYFILLTPLNAVRFSVLIARDEKNFEDIKEWVQTHTAHNLDECIAKFKQYVSDPVEEVVSLYERGRTDHDQDAIQKAKEIRDSWLAVDIYPEYKMEEKETIEFLQDLINKTPTAPFFNK